MFLAFGLFGFAGAPSLQQAAAFASQVRNRSARWRSLPGLTGDCRESDPRRGLPAVAL